MRRITLLLALALIIGCGKKPPAPQPDGGDETPQPNPGAAEPSEKDKLLAALKSRKIDTQRDAADALATLAETDPTVIDALVELLKDKANAGPGKVKPLQVNSTREAAAVALVRCGPKGEEALRDRGIAILRDGLTDKDVAVREHTAYTLGVIGPLMKPLGVPLQRLCQDPDPNVRAAAFDALRTVGIADISQLAGLLTNKDPNIRRSAAELISTLPEVSAAAIPSLTRALDDPDDIIRFAASEGIATASPKGASAVTAEKLAAVIEKTYPPMIEPNQLRPDAPEEVYWRALMKIGKPSVTPVTELLKHKNAFVRMMALRTLGDIGAVAKSSADAVKKLLTDEIAEVALEAASTLFRLGIDDPEAGRLIQIGLDSTARGVGAASVFTVARMGSAGKSFVAPALAKLGSPQPDVRFAAVVLVGRLEPAEAAKSVPTLAKMLADPEMLIRREVGTVLEKLGPAASSAADAVGKALLVEMDDVTRSQFVDALVAMGPGAKPAVAGLVPLIGDPNFTVAMRVKIIAAVVVADPASKEVVAALLKAAGDREQPIRAASAIALGKLDPLPPEALAGLVKMAKTDKALPVRVAAVRAIAEAGPKAKAARADLETIANGTLPGLALWAKVAIAAVDGNVGSASATVRAGLDHKQQDVRSASAELLTLIGPTAADVPALRKLLKQTAASKAAAALALGKIGPPAKDAVPRLADLLSDPDSEVRIASAEALGRIGPAAMPAAAKLRDAMTDPLVAPTARKAMARIGIAYQESKKP